MCLRHESFPHAGLDVSLFSLREGHMSGLVDHTTLILQQTLDLSLRRQTVLQSNVANLSTPGHTPSDIRFKEALHRAQAPSSSRGLSQTHTGHMDVSAAGHASESTYTRPDREADATGNSVDLDRQMARMAHNQVLYSASTRVVNRRFALLRYALSEGMG